MSISSLAYLFKEGIKNLINNKLMSLASVGVLTACLLVVGFSTLISENLNKTIDFFGEQSSIVVFLKDETSPEQLENINNTLKSNDKVKEIRYTSKDKALKDYRDFLQDEYISQILNEKNVLPASIDIIVKHVSYIDEVVEITKNFDFIYSTRVPSRVANTIKEIEKTLGYFEIILILALIIISLVIISNTIRANVFARRREITIMKQVGATDSFVRFPFVVEGIIIGVTSAIIAFIVISLIYRTIFMLFSNGSKSIFLMSLFGRFISFNKVSFLIATNFLLGGIGAGVFGSIISLKKYLKS